MAVLSCLQLAVLNDSAAEDLGDQDALEAALEAELAAEEEEGPAAAPTPATGKKKARPPRDRKHNKNTV